MTTHIRRQIPFNVLQPDAALVAELQAAANRVIAGGWYVLGPEVEAFEAEFAAYHGMPYAVGVATGTDAIELMLRAFDIGPGDEVITVAHTALASVSAIERAGATPVLVDIDPHTYTMNPQAAEAAITSRTAAIMPVHLYGQMADMDALKAIAERHQVRLLEDCAQSHAARYRGQMAGTIGDAASFSFYPTKNLGAYGDGGAVLVRDALMAERLKRLRNYGQTSRYYHVERGINSRLDEIQAALLRVRLRHLDAETQHRQQIAALYDEHLRDFVTIPARAPHAEHVYHLYVVRHPQRDAFMRALKEEHGVGTLIHYPVPIHLQESHVDLGYAAGSLPHTEQAALEICSLPLYPSLSPEDARYVADAIQKVVDSWR